MTDDELVNAIANAMDVSEERVIEIAADRVGSRFRYNEFFKTGVLPFEIRGELRNAKEILRYHITNR